MTDEDIRGQRLHDRATRGKALTPEERLYLEEWYARLDNEEAAEILCSSTALRNTTEVAVMNSLSGRVKLVVGDITRLAVDAIVTAANEALCGGGGVDGAVHRAAGPGLLEECLKIGHCPPGEARITKAYLLPARFVIHTVGPVWEGGGYGEAGILASCYRASLKLAAERGAETVAFPCIATGAYGYPPTEACDIAVTSVLEWLREHELPREVVFCCFGADDAEVYRSRLGEIGSSR